MRSDATINQANIAELKQGYAFSGTTQKFSCLCCGFHTEPGRIYPMGDNLYDAEGAMRTHIRQNHQSALSILLELDKRWTGLTELQTLLIRLFASGISDQEIAAAVDAGSVSTIRNHRFLLRERLKQAKVFVAIAELMAEQASQPALSPKSRPGNPADDETQKILSRYFPQGISGPLATFPTREKRRLILLKEIATRFTPDRRYSEQEVNAILGAVYEDHVLLRRLLIDYGLLARRPDGSEYWRVSDPPGTETATGPVGPANDEEESEMDERRKELIRQYKETPLPMGVFQIKNNRNGKELKKNLRIYYAEVVSLQPIEPAVSFMKQRGLTLIGIPLAVFLVGLLILKYALLVMPLTLANTGICCSTSLRFRRPCWACCLRRWRSFSISARPRNRSILSACWTT